MMVELANFYNPMFGQGMGGGGNQPINYMDILALQGGNSQFVQQQMMQNALEQAYMAGAMDGAMGAAMSAEQQMGMLMVEFYQYAMMMDFQFSQMMQALAGQYMPPPQPAPIIGLTVSPALSDGMDADLMALLAQLLAQDLGSNA
jgi:hypothetical protein